MPALSLLMEAREAAGQAPERRRLLAEAGIDIEPGSGATSRAAEEVQAAGAQPARRGRLDSSAERDSDLLDSLLGGESDARTRSAPRAASKLPAGDEALGQAIRDLLAETIDDVDFAEQDRWREAIEAELTVRLRAILHDPIFRRLEVGWAALRSLVRSAERDGEPRILMADLPQQAFEAEALDGIALRDSGLYRLVAESEATIPGERTLDLLVTDYCFDAGARSRAALARLGELGEAAGVPILAAATGSATAIDQASEEDLAGWTELQASSGSRWVALCAPRILVREPYGADSHAIDSFPFDEGAGPEAMDRYQWGCATVCLARAAIRALALHGDLAQTARFDEIEGLPMHVARVDGEAVAVGPVDEVLTEPKLEAWSLMGVIPVTGVRGSDSARILSLRSLARTSLMGFR